MHNTSLYFALAGLTSVALAGRGSLVGGTSTICNEEPTQSAFVYAPLPTCLHAADPSGAMGLCTPSQGWCDCGAEGDYPVLADGLCKYTSLPPTKLTFTKSPCVKIQTVTVVPVPATKRDESVPAQATPPIIERGGGGGGGGVISANLVPKPGFVPVQNRRYLNSLSKRQGSITYSNCDDPAPDVWKKAGYATKKDVIAKAYSDALVAARTVSDVAADNTGFTHYFGGEEPDIQLEHFKKMMSAIGDTKNNYFSVKFECKDIPQCTKPGGSGKQSMMVTDASKGSASTAKTIQVCEQFFTATATKYLLPIDHGKETPSPPFREFSNWCQKKDKSNVSGRNAAWYATASHTILHELTHLDSLAAQAGLQVGDKGRSKGVHSTDDYQDDPNLKINTRCQFKGARAFLALYKEKKTEETSPDYNAESYAAAATEIFFMKTCGFSSIQ